MIAYEVSAFTRNDKGGNLAGVIILEDLLSDQQMQQISKQLGYSETAFIEVFEKNIFNIRFFSPEMEVDLCGHATIAAFHLLKDKGYITKKEAFQYTRAGKLKVIVKDDFLMETSPAKLLKDIHKDECAKILNINKDDIVNIPKIVEVGIADVMVVVKDYETLNSININKSDMIDFSNENGVSGFHVCTIEKGKYYVRNFAPVCGIDEESATGTANGSMYVYLESKGYLKGDEKVSFYQGDHMNLSSQINVQKIDDIIWIGGKANIIKEIEVYK